AAAAPPSLTHLSSARQPGPSPHSLLSADPALAAPAGRCRRPSSPKLRSARSADLMPARTCRSAAARSADPTDRIGHSAQTAPADPIAPAALVVPAALVAPAVRSRSAVLVGLAGPASAPARAATAPPRVAASPVASAAGNSAPD